MIESAVYGLNEGWFELKEPETVVVNNPANATEVVVKDSEITE